MSRSMMRCLQIVFGLAFGAFAVQSHAHSAVPDWNISEIPEAGFPHFQDRVRVKFERERHGFELTAKERHGMHLFQLDPDTAYQVGNADFELEAHFDRFLNFTGGTLHIAGKIPELGLDHKTTLWDADLSDFGVDLDPFDTSPIALAFETTNQSGWATQFLNGTTESIYLTGLHRLDLSRMFRRHGVSFDATAITTVPLPPAVWLLGAGLFALFGMGRATKSVNANDDAALAAA